MATYNLLIATPEKILFNGDVISAIFPGTEGFFEILANHASIIAMLKAGTVEITDAGEKKHSVHIEEGFLEFHHTGGILLTMDIATGEEEFHPTEAEMFI